jgi:twinkle protein
MGDARGPLNAHEALLQQKDFKEILSKASILKHDQIIDFHELRDEVYREFLSPDQAKGVQSTDLPALNAVLKGHRPGELTILTGPTGVGKTTIISQLSLDYCKSGVTTLWGSFEILNKRLAKKMLCQFAEKDLSQNPLEFDVWADKFEQVLLLYGWCHGTKLDSDFFLALATIILFEVLWKHFNQRCPTSLPACCLRIRCATYHIR